MQPINSKCLVNGFVHEVEHGLGAAMRFSLNRPVLLRGRAPVL
jgi:hypothetical protein